MLDKDRLFKYVDMMLESVWANYNRTECPEKMGKIKAYSDIHKRIKEGEFDVEETNGD